MELHDADLVLRSWAEPDVPALVESCNDPEISRWIQAMPTPYTEDDALAFVAGTSPRSTHLAITLEGEVVGAIGIGVNGRAIGGISATGSPHQRVVAGCARGR